MDVNADSSCDPSSARIARVANVVLIVAKFAALECFNASVEGGLANVGGAAPPVGVLTTETQALLGRDVILASGI